MSNAITNKRQELWFLINGKPPRFFIKEFVLVMGLICGKVPSSLRKKAEGTQICNTYFGGTNQIYKKDLQQLLQNWPRGKPHEDQGKIALLYFLEATLLSMDKKKLVSQVVMFMVDDLPTFNKYPWGTMSFSLTMEQLEQKDWKAKYNYYKQDLQPKGNKATYTLYGFPFAFLVGISDVI
ncbi:hypothetical protein UlMin_010189 [Ulmus minor]